MSTMPRNHWWFTFPFGGLFEGPRLYNPSGSREVVPGEVIQGGPDHPLLLFQEFPRGWLPARWAPRPCSACESPGRLQGESRAEKPGSCSCLEGNARNGSVPWKILESCLGPGLD